MHLSFKRLPGERIREPRSSGYESSVDPSGRRVKVIFQCGHFKTVRESKACKVYKCFICGAKRKPGRASYVNKKEKDRHCAETILTNILRLYSYDAVTNISKGTTSLCKVLLST